ncbi:hypothetical protein [Kyrpidia tusciae]|uniref:hypothetical protein n=1 Tax=Kyrpidia tusciae TaxID=33943 RepID=UPI0002F89C93|nr:hypothetical protein [Kyrpidia tusciae]
MSKRTSTRNFVRWQIFVSIGVLKKYQRFENQRRKGVMVVCLMLTLRPLSGRDDSVLPLTYNEYVQAALYRILPQDFAAFLHDEGYPYLKLKFDSTLGLTRVRRLKFVPHAL